MSQLTEFGLSADEIDLGDPAFWVRPAMERDAAFTLLRRDRPVSFHTESDYEGLVPAPGYWALTRYDDIRFAALWYYSANRDEDVFDRADEFDITRASNEHVAFGAGGPHFCLGAHLARREIRVLLRELYQVLPDIEASGEPAMLRSNFLHGIKHLDAEFTPV